ncbi:peptidase U32 family protein [Paenibacillus sp. YN15]|uniref:peptidase U32 family protein n=1 Tax=Paenibacillus sp. YN15 TaxID=1742774 RepID=UPI000DCBEB03|nr:peptidase U32 family protein [Paenibacillus sp. YN15]RAU96352.1 U32 family peptidase [Paenibacillus sp. YN15]
MKRTELLTAAGSLAEIRHYAEAGADAVQIGEHRFGARLPGDIPVGLLKEAVQTAHGCGMKAYVVANRIFDNAAVAELPDYLIQVAEAGADAVGFGDPSLLSAAREAGLDHLPLHWNPEMTATNYMTANYWADRGAVRAVLARELNMEQVLEFKKRCKADVQVQVHGATNIFHSKRRMVKSYMEHRGESAAQGAFGMEQGLYLIEEERQDERYPIYEDEAGTHIMSGDDLCMLDALEELLAAGIDSMKVESLLKPVAYNAAALFAYRQAIDAYAADPEGYSFREEWMEPIIRLQPPNRPLTYGFYFKEQVY